MPSSRSGIWQAGAIIRDTLTDFFRRGEVLAEDDRIRRN